MKIKNLIIWAWLSWVVLSQKLAEKWEEVLIIEKRNHIWWNCYDYYDENWILVHKYWPHIFHTNYEDVWKYVNKFSNFTNYQHKVLWFIDGKLAPIPFNLESLYILISKEYAKKIENSLLKYYSYNSRVSINELKQKAKETWDKNLEFIADYIFEKIFKNYTIKQWWIKPEEINPEVLKRVPILISKDPRYFQDKFQWMPEKWYTEMMEKMLESKNIKVMLNTDFKEIKNKIEYKRLIFTWAIDEYFDYKYWKLDYKKTLYKLETIDKKEFQQATTVNYPNDYEFTRISEFKKMYLNSPTYNIEKTVICTEIPWIWEIKAYPVETEKNLKVLEKYKQETKKLENVYFVGRLANYKYFNMDQTIKNALDFYNNNLK